MAPPRRVFGCLAAGLLGLALGAPVPTAVAAPSPGWPGGSDSFLGAPDPSQPAPRIAFVDGSGSGGSTLAWMNANGTDVRAITTPLPSPGVATDAEPAWTPDASVLAFVSDRGGSRDLWTVQADGGGLVQLTADPGDELDPAWSPDGLHIAYARSRSAKGGATVFDIVVANPDGSDAVAITTATGADRDPAWSPDATRLAFVRDGIVTLMDATGANVTPLVPSVPGASSPAWSPDGTTIAFDAVANGRSDVLVVHPDGSGLATLTGATSGGSHPSWAPDGKRLVYAASGSAAPAVATILPDGTCPATIRTGTAGETLGAPAWQPDAPRPLGLSVTPACRSIQRGSRTSATLHLARNGLASPVDLSIAGLPPGATASFGPDPAWLTTATLAIQTSECGTATRMGTFTLTVTGTADGVTATTTLVLVVSDGGPQATSPVTTLLTGTKGLTTTPTKTTWSACDHEPISSYALDRRSGTGSWARMTTGATTSVSQSLTDGTSYAYRSGASDPRHPIGSAWTTGPTFAPKVTESGSSIVHTTGTWTPASSSAYSNGTTRYATDAGASMTMTFTGSAVAWLGDAGPALGAAQVFIDGVYKAKLTEYATTAQPRRLMYAANWPAQGRHTIRIVTSGTAGHPQVDVDAFITLYGSAAYVQDGYSGHMTTESPENITCVSASALTASNDSWGIATAEYYSHAVAADWYDEVRSPTEDLHDRYDYTGIEAGLDPRGWAWLLWAHAPPNRGYHDYWSADQATVDGWLVSNIRDAGEAAGAIVFRSIHAVDVVGFSSNIDPHNGAATTNGFFVVDPWYPNATSTYPDGGKIGLAPDTYLTLATWNASYFLPYVDKPYEAVHGANLWHGQFVAILRSADGTPEPDAVDDTMPVRYGAAGTNAATTGGATVGGSTLADPATAEDGAARNAVHATSDVLGAVRDGIVEHGLQQAGTFATLDPAGLRIGRRLVVAGLGPDIQPYELAEVMQAGRVVAVAMLQLVDGGLRFAGLQSAYAGNAMRDAAGAAAAFQRAGLSIHGLHAGWLPSSASFEPFSPLWIGTDARGATHYLTPGGTVLEQLAQGGR
ncbi:MAG TPA: hypothetical protein VGI98_04300 [Candidatus Limnocylindrales bacterium]